jgi:hypothetical protein
MWRNDEGPLTLIGIVTGGDRYVEAAVLSLYRNGFLSLLLVCLLTLERIAG